MTIKLKIKNEFWDMLVNKQKFAEFRKISAMPKLFEMGLKEHDNLTIEFISVESTFYLGKINVYYFKILPIDCLEAQIASNIPWNENDDKIDKITEYLKEYYKDEKWFVVFQLNHETLEVY